MEDHGPLAASAPVVGEGDAEGEAESTAARESWGGVLGVGLGLLLLVGLVAQLARTRLGTVDPAALAAAEFELDPLPFGLAPVEGATLANGDRTALFRASEDAQRGPAEVLLAVYPAGRARSQLKRLFERSEGGDARGGGGGRRGGRGGGGDGGIGGPEYQDGRLVLDRDTLAWGAFDVQFVHLRKSDEEAETFEDQARVNLSSADRGRVLFVRWTPNVELDEAELGRLLAAFRPR